MAHACTLANTNLAYHTITIQTGGTVTYAGTCSLAVRTLTASTGSAHAQRLDATADVTLNGDFVCNTTDNARGWTTAGANARLTVNGVWRNTSSGWGVRASHSGAGLTINGDVINEGNAGRAIYGSKYWTAGISITGNIYNRAPDAAGSYGYGVNCDAGCHVTVTGTCYNQGCGWSVRVTGGVITVNGDCYLDNTCLVPADNHGGDCIDCSGGRLSVYGNIYSQASDVAVYVRGNSSVAVYGSVQHRQNGSTLVQAVRMEGGNNQCVIFGDVIVTNHLRGNNHVLLNSGTLTVWGNIVGTDVPVNVLIGPGATLNSYRALQSDADSWVNNGTWNHAQDPTIELATLGTHNKIEWGDAVTVVATALSCTEASLTWHPSRMASVAGMKEWRLYRDGAYRASSRYPAFTDRGLSPSCRYWYRVCAVDDGDNECFPSDPTCVSTALPACPLLSVTKGVPPGGVVLRETGTSGYSYTVESSVDLTTWSYVMFFDSTNASTVIPVDGPPALTRTFYRVRFAP